MKNYLAFLRVDLKNIFRDPSLFMVFTVPVVFWALLRFGLPKAILLFPLLDVYSPSILAFCCLMVATFPAFVSSFILLDEKDQGVVQVIRILPISPRLFLAYRIMFVAGFAYVFSACLLAMAGVAHLTLVQVLGLAFLSALSGIATKMVVISFAENKIEGITIFKVLNILLVLPLLEWVIESEWTHLLGIIPYYWVYRMLGSGIQDGGFAFQFMLGTAIHFVYIGWLYRIFVNRVMNR